MNDFVNLDGKQFGCILADPPWHFKVRSPKGEDRSASQHYNVMSMHDLKQMPVASWAAPNSVLLMWACDPMLPDAFDLIKAWGFEYKTVGFYWVKQNRKSSGLFTGMGYWTRANCEICLLATRGHPKRKAMDVARVIVAPRREHSRKPDEIIDRIERLVDGPYIELFSRQRRDGWDSWGNEPDKFVLPMAHDLLPI